MAAEEPFETALGMDAPRGPIARTPIQAIDRAVSLLQTVAAAGHSGAGLTQIAESVGLHNSTCRTLLNSLVTHRMLEQDARTRRYMLGTRFIELNRLHASHTDLSAAAAPVVKRLWESTRETVHLAVLQGIRRVDITVLVSPQILNVNPVVKDSGPQLIGAKAQVAEELKSSLISTSAGKVLLSGLDDQNLRLLLEKVQSDLSGAGSIPMDDHLREVESIRALGYATNYEQVELGVCGVAAAVYDHTDTVCAALCVGYPSVRRSESYDVFLRDQVISSASELSLLLGADTSGRAAS